MGILTDNGTNDEKPCLTMTGSTRCCFYIQRFLFYSHRNNDRKIRPWRLNSNTSNLSQARNGEVLRGIRRCAWEKRTSVFNVERCPLGPVNQNATLFPLPLTLSFLVVVSGGGWPSKYGFHRSTYKRSKTHKIKGEIITIFIYIIYKSKNNKTKKGVLVRYCQ